jgi:Dyp-type peroxidase family
VKTFSGDLSPLAQAHAPEIPGAPQEPVLDVHDIQGSVLVGFNKDHQHFIFLEITDVDVAKSWLRQLVPRIATTEETLVFRRLFRALRVRRGVEPHGMGATWTNIALTAEGIRKLTSEEEVTKFASASFKAGLARQSRLLGDPTNVAAEGHPDKWVIGNATSRPDLLILVASDSSADLKAEIRRIKDEIKVLQGAAPTRRSKAGLRILYEQPGKNLPGDLSGHEHFGFKDGVSQPGVRGRVSQSPDDFLTPRLIDPADAAHAVRFSKPGQPLVWPGQFVLGYALQGAHDDLEPVLPDETDLPWPAWARNGSFLVFRRLRQDVAGFWAFARTQSELLKQKPGFQNMTPERLASLLVGRWPSGAPIMRTPEKDLEPLGGSDIANNNFRFSQDTEPMQLRPNIRHAPDNFPQATADAGGLRCPYSAHIRKVNPRDDTTDLGGGRLTLQKRILRRGIAYGPPLENPRTAPDDGADRGLLFLCYQASIEDQFELLSEHWVNSTILPKDYSQAEHPAGHDPIIGETDGVAGRSRVVTVPATDGSFETIRIPGDFITPTGGDYFFTPSLTALRTVLAGEDGGSA